VSGVPIEDAYCGASDRQVHACAPCDVTWVGAEDRCWVCGGIDEGPVVVLPASGAHTWSWRSCEEDADGEETAAFLRRVTAP
jgi:hypothetical protein